MTNSIKEISNNVYKIIIFDYRRGFNYLNYEWFKRVQLKGLNAKHKSKMKKLKNLTCRRRNQ